MLWGMPQGLKLVSVAPRFVASAKTKRRKKVLGKAKTKPTEPQLVSPGDLGADQRLEALLKPPMRVEEVGVRALAPASLGAEDPEQVATLRGGPLLEIRDEPSDRRHLREGAPLGRRPRGPAGDAERAPHPRRRLQ